MKGIHCLYFPNLEDGGDISIKYKWFAYYLTILSHTREDPKNKIIFWRTYPL